MEKHFEGATAWLRMETGVLTEVSEWDSAKFTGVAKQLKPICDGLLILLTWIEEDVEKKNFPGLRRDAFWLETVSHALKGLAREQDKFLKGVLKASAERFWTIHEVLEEIPISEKRLPF